jgi:serine/threonine-protein phosphatase PGAM5
MDFEPKVYRTIVFVRHGQYQKGPERLTALGRRQAGLVAKAIKPLKPAKLFCSTMPRAKETAKIIGAQAKLKSNAKGFFREGLLPGTIGFYEKLTKKSSRSEKLETKRKMKVAKVNADAAFKFLFRPPKTGQTCEIVVAHGNVIRHWVCKALKIDQAKWLSMDVSHTSLTTIRVDKNGKFVLLGFSDNGHLPHKMRTYV